MKTESKQNNNELKALDSETYRLMTEERTKKTEEWTKNDEERRRTSTESLTETSRKRYGSTSTSIFSFFLFSSLISSESLLQNLLDP